MTDNKIYPMSADFFDNSSNSSNLLKLDIFPSDFLISSGSNSNSSFGFSTIAGFVAKNLPQNSITSQSQSAPISIVTITTPSTASSSLAAASLAGTSTPTSSLSPSLAVNPTATTIHAGSISALSPNLNQCMNLSPSSRTTAKLSSSPSITSSTSIASPSSSTSSMENNLRANPMFNSTASISIPHKGLNCIGIGNNSNNSNNQLYNHNQTRGMGEFSEYGLDVLDASSLSPSFVQETNLSLTPHSSNSPSLHNNYNSLIFINNVTSPSSSPMNISHNSHSSGGGGGSVNSSLGNHFVSNNNNSSSHNNSHNNNNNSGQMNIGNISHNTISSPTNNDLIIYEINTVDTNQHDMSNNSNTLWSDIGNAMISTKTEPFSMEDDYIFQLDKADLIHSPTLAELNGETLLEDLNIDDLIQTDNDTTYFVPHHGQLHQLQNVNSVNLSSHQLSQQHSNIGGNNVGGNQNCNNSLDQHGSNQINHNSSAGIPMQTNQNSYHSMKLFDDQNTVSSSSPYELQHSTPIKDFQHSNAAFSPGSQTSSSPLQMQSSTPPLSQNQYITKQQLQQQNTNILQQKHNSSSKVTPIHELILNKNYSQSPDRSSVLGQSVPGPSAAHILLSGAALSPVSSGFGSISGQNSSRKLIGLSSSNGGNIGLSSSSRLSSSAPTHLHLDEIMQQRRSDFSFDHPIWRRREPRQHLLSTGSSIAEAESISSISTASILSPEHDEGYSDYDTDQSDYSSDGSDNEDDTPRGSNSKPKERYFWQYNVQAKGPKGQRLVIKTQQEDPHVLNEVTDPVFSPNCSVRGIKVFKHSGKARKGDGNDLTPNPKKLHSIGRELEKLGRQINEMPPVSELPTNTRQKTRKEKNKLASRACRLKKKAQHEANKIKLFGLELEHRKLLNGINDVKNCLAMKYQNQNPNQINQNENNEELNNQIEKVSSRATTIQIAGNSTEFVNTILDKVKTGIPHGGLDELKAI